MNLSKFAKKWYEVEIQTSPQITTGWQATFDDGASWLTGEVVATPDPAPVAPTAVVVRWLVAGPEAGTGGDTPDVVLTEGVQPILRAEADPEVEAVSGPLIILQ